MRADHRRIRLYTEAALAPGAEVALDSGQAHYLRNVMRRSAGDAVFLFNGSAGEWRAEIAALDRRGGRARCGERFRAPVVEPDLWLLFAPLKRAAVDFVAEKATELGVSALRPVVTERTAVARINVERLRAHAIEAAEQSDRLNVPEVGTPRPLRDVLAGWDENRRLLWADESGGGAPVADALAAAGPGPWAVLIGPEGGFAPGELDLLRSMSIVTAVSLGSRILRADTAALAALACLQAVVGDWRPGRRPPPAPHS